MQKSIINGGAGNNLSQQKILAVKSMSPQEMRELWELNKSHKESKINKFGYAEKAGLRHVASIPYDVYTKLIEIDPDIAHSKEKMKQTLDMFPIFKSSKVV